MNQRVSLVTSDGQTLEARWDSPANPVGVVVFCHPHPLQRGSMMAPLMIAVTTRLVERGLSVLRFNFRGSGNSTGTHDHGDSEKLDVSAAIESAQATGLPLNLSGWSFGAAVALHWLGGQSDPIPYSAVAPPPDDLPEHLPPGPKRIVEGTRDQVVDVERLRRYASEHQIDLVLTPGDHFFHSRGHRVGDLVAEGFKS